MSTLSIHDKINQLPPELLTEIEDYIDFILFKYAKKASPTSLSKQEQAKQFLADMRKDSFVGDVISPIDVEWDAMS